MASTPIWGAVVDYFTATLKRELLDRVEVHDGHPGELGPASGEHLWVDDEITSESSMPVAVGGTKPYDDTFELLIRYTVMGRKDRKATRDRVNALMGEVHTLLAADPTLGDLDGVLSASIVRRRSFVVVDTDGPKGLGETYLSIHSRISPN